MVLGRQGGYKEAERIPFQELKGCEKVLRLEHPDILKATGDLKLVVFSQEQFVEAEQWYKQVHATSKRLLEDFHPDTLLTRVNHPFS
jgi:hypothetical protein